MFDKLIVSDEQGADFKGRSRYFMVSTFVVGVLFISAVVFSLYAADIGLGVDQLEMSVMVAPLTPESPEPAKPIQVQNQPQSSKSNVPVRNENILRPEESPIAIPTDISVARSTVLTRPIGRFMIGRVETSGQGDPGNSRAGVIDGTSSAASSQPIPEAENIPELPPAIKSKPPTPLGPVSMGVVNGRATSLPKPPYPAAAIAVGAAGQVTVQVLIDESGRVVSAKAVDGHLLLKREAERAALNARFSPTLLSKVPVKVTGVIVYNFKRS